MERNESCEKRVQESFDSRMSDLRRLWQMDNGELSKDEEKKVKDEIGELNEYGLCLDFVEAGTFKNQREDYIRYQISYGGPSEEFRIFKNGEVEFWLLDWFDGAPIELDTEDAQIIKYICSCEIDNQGWKI